MSLNALISNEEKSWADLRVDTITCDTSLTVTAEQIDQAAEFSGAAIGGFVSTTCNIRKSNGIVTIQWRNTTGTPTGASLIELRINATTALLGVGFRPVAITYMAVRVGNSNDVPANQIGIVRANPSGVVEFAYSPVFNNFPAAGDNTVFEGSCSFVAA